MRPDELQPRHGTEPVFFRLNHRRSTIAYGDCLTAKRANIINRQDHAAAPRLLRDVLRDSLPATQEKRYRRILATKDESQYGTRSATLDYAQRLLSELEAFARWAEDQL